MSAEPNPMKCPRCETDLAYVSTKAFHEGTRWGFLGELGELFVNKERFESTSASDVDASNSSSTAEFRPH